MSPPTGKPSWPPHPTAKMLSNTIHSKPPQGSPVLLPSPDPALVPRFLLRPLGPRQQLQALCAPPPPLPRVPISLLRPQPSPPPTHHLKTALVHQRASPTSTPQPLANARFLQARVLRLPASTWKILGFPPVKFRGMRLRASLEFLSYPPLHPRGLPCAN